MAVIPHKIYTCKKCGAVISVPKKFEDYKPEKCICCGGSLKLFNLPR